MAVFWVEPWVDAQYPQPGAVVDGGELVVLAGGAALDWRDELDVDLDLVAGELLFVAEVSLVEPFVALRGGETVELETFEDPPHSRVRDGHVVVAVQVHRDPRRAEVVVLPQVEDLADDVDMGGVRAHLRAS